MKMKLRMTMMKPVPMRILLKITSLTKSFSGLARSLAQRRSTNGHLKVVKIRKMTKKKFL